MATTIVTKYGSDAPADTDIVRGELAVDTENGRLYTENSSGAVVELGLNPEGALTADAGIDIDNINIDGTTIALSSGDLTLDVAGNLLLNADGGGIYFQDASLLVGSLQNSSSDLLISAEVADKDIIFRGIDDSTTIDALKLDMENAGAATFNSSVTADGLTVEGNGTYLASLNNTAQDARIQLSREGTEFGQVSAGANLMNLVASGASTDMRFLTNSLERMRIDSSGRVSIGRSGNVTAKCLELQPPAQISDFLSYILNIGGDEADDAVGTKSGIGFGYTSDARPAAPATIGYETKDTGGGTYGDLYFATRATGGTEQPTERMRIDSSGNVGIGTTSPKGKINSDVGNTSTVGAFSSSGLNITSTSGAANNIYQIGFGYASGATNAPASIYALTTSNAGFNNNAICFATRSVTTDTAPTERMRIDSSGILEVQHDAYDGMQRSLTLSNPRNAAGSGDGTSIYFNNTGTSTIARSAYIGSVSETNYGQSNTLVFGVSSGGDAPTEAARIDSNKNLLVGKTSNTISAAGAKLGTGGSNFTRSGAEVVYFNRTTDDGEIATFAKDGTTVGSIGVSGGNNLFISGQEADHAGLTFATQSVLPTTQGVINNDTVDLGQNGNSFDDIYATNGTIQTSDRNEKQDIAELSDAEQRVAVAAKGLLRKFRWKSSVEEKGDEARTHFGIIAQDLQAAFAAEGLDAGDYAMFINGTWTDEETGEERSRMGVRYSELLAFIIAAI